MNIKSQALLEHLIVQGAIEMSGIDQYGEMTYSITDTRGPSRTIHGTKG